MSPEKCDSYTIQFKDDVYGALWNDEAVILDLTRDQYVGLDECASELLLELLGSTHFLNSAECFRAILSPPLKRVIFERLSNFIEFVPSPGDLSRQRAAKPNEPGGLSICEWRPQESPFIKNDAVSKRQVYEALLTLGQVDYLLSRKRLSGLLCALESFKGSDKQPTLNVKQSLSRLHWAIQEARLWYPRDVNCLIGSGALALMSIRRGLAVQFAVGVQKYPFFAHAWIEYVGTVINDSPEVNQRLSVLLRKPSAASTE